MKKHTVLIIISFTLITAATIWLFHRELVFSTYCHCFNQVSYKIRNQQTSQKSFKFYAEAGAYLGELMTKYQKHFEPVIFEYLRSSNEEKAMHAYNILAEGNTIPDYKYIELYEKTAGYNAKVRILNLMPQSDASVKFLIDKLNDTKTEQGLREMMAARLSDFQRPEATAFFEKHLTDPNKGVKIYAMSYLARLSYKTYRTRIKEMMKDPDSDVSQAAENTIDMFDQIAENPDAKDGINENDPYKIIKGMPGSQEENEK